MSKTMLYHIPDADEKVVITDEMLIEDKMSKGKKKYHAFNVEFKFDSGEEALTELIECNCEPIDSIYFKLEWNTLIMVERIVMPVIYKGVRIEDYYEWNGYLFHKMLGYYRMVGGLKNE